MTTMVGEGIYSVGESSRLTGVSPSRIHRWFSGYQFETKLGVRRMPPVVSFTDRMFDGQLQLSFSDLLEIRLIDRFLDLDVGWHELRQVAKIAKDRFGCEHPFADYKFRTSGRRLFADVNDHRGEKRLVEFSSQQHVFERVIENQLIGVEYVDDSAVRWWPLGLRKNVVIDPRRAFGKPIGSTSGVPAAILAAHAARFGQAVTSDWYEVDRAEVRDAAIFMKRLAA